MILHKCSSFIEFIKYVGGKKDKMRGLPSILSLLRNEFNKLNNTSSSNDRFYLSYHTMGTLNLHFGVQSSRVCQKSDVAMTTNTYSIHVCSIPLEVYSILIHIRRDAM